MCWPLLHVYVTHFVVLRDVWIQTQSFRKKQARHNLATHLPINLAAHLPNLVVHLPNLATHLPNLAWRARVCWPLFCMHRSPFLYF